jgi:HEAT repeat protein
VRKPLKIVLAVLLVAIAGVMAWQMLRLPKREQDPIIDGKPLTFWLEHRGASGKSSVQAEWAMLRAGTNAIPTLLRLQRQRDSLFKRGVMWLLQRQHWFKTHFVGAEQQNETATWGFRQLAKSRTIAGITVPQSTKLSRVAGMAVPQLTEIYERRVSVSSRQTTASSLGVFGPVAQEAIPALVRGLADNDRFVRAFTASALGNIHSKPEIVVPALVECLSDTDALVRGDAAFGLSQFGEEARPAAPVLLRAAKDADQFVRINAFWALKQFRADPQLTIPVLVAGLDDPYWPIRDHATASLGNYGAEAKAAVPALLRLLATNRLASFEYQAIEQKRIVSALKKIDPEATAKAGVK